MLFIIKIKKALYSKTLKFIQNKELILNCEENDYMKTELNLAFDRLDKFARVYETMFLLNSYTEELKLFIARIYINPQKTIIKTLFVKNRYDTMEKLQQDLIILINNFKIIQDGLKDFPEWQAKFVLDIEKQFAFINIQKNFPEVYMVQDKQRLFK